MGLDWIGLDGWLSYTAVTPRASLKSDANKKIEIFLLTVTMLYFPMCCYTKTVIFTQLHSDTLSLKVDFNCEIRSDSLIINSDLVQVLSYPIIILLKIDLEL